MAKSKFELLSREMEEREGFGNSLIIFVIAALIVSVLGWASIAELDNVTRGDGKIVSTTQNQMVQSSESGVILSRSVDENSLVQADDVLYEINPIELQSELDKLQQRAATLFVREFRLQAESQGLEFAPDASMMAQSEDTAATEEAFAPCQAQGALWAHVYPEASKNPTGAGSDRSPAGLGNLTQYARPDRG